MLPAIQEEKLADYIDVFCFLGLASNPKRATAAWSLARVRRDRERAAGVALPRAPPRPWEVKKATDTIITPGAETPIKKDM